MAEHVTFFRMRALPGRAAELAQLMTDRQLEVDRMRAAGWMSTVVGRRKGSDDEFWGAVTWDTSERYDANAAAPEQDEWFQRVRALLAEDPEWFDCDVVDEHRS